MHATKIVGMRLRPTSAVQSLAMASKLRHFAKRVTKHPAPRGFVVKGRTWEEADALWKLKIIQSHNG